MRRFSPWLLLLALAACGSNDAPLDPPPVESATYELQKVDGLAFGDTPITAASGVRTMIDGAWEETVSITSRETNTFVDHGTYTSTVDGSRRVIRFVSAVHGNEHTGVALADRLTVESGTFVYHWRRR